MVQFRKLIGFAGILLVGSMFCDAQDTVPSVVELTATAFGAAGNPAADSVPVRVIDPDDGPMGATPVEGGVYFRVWAPLAQAVAVEGGFTPTPLPMTPETSGGRWHLFVAGAAVGDTYQFRLTGFYGGSLEKMDPYARHVEHSAGWCYVYDPGAYPWGDAGFAAPPADQQVLYEMHVGTFAGRNDGAPNSPATFADALAKIPHLQELGVNMVEVLPVGEFPGARSWGYNPSLPFAPESTYGGPDAFKAFVDACHQAGIGVILDVVHNHYGPFDLDLWQFDGWYDAGAPAEWRGGIYFYNDWRADTPWGDTRPDYGRPEVRQYIIDNAVYWLAEYHLDGLRWDSTVNIRQCNGTDLPDGWLLLQNANDTVDFAAPAAVMIAEDLQNWDGLTAATAGGGAGFDAQWHARFVHNLRDVLVPASDSARDMNKVLQALPAAYQGDAARQVIYTESHDEDANGHQRLPSEIDSGDGLSYWARKRSTLGAGVLFTAPGVPMLFMGQELHMDGWWADTDGSDGTYDGRVDWAYKTALRGIFEEYVDLVALRKALPGLRTAHLNTFHTNHGAKVMAWHRWNLGSGADDLVVIANFSNTPFPVYRLGLPYAGRWASLFHGDSRYYAADFQHAEGRVVTADAQAYDGFNYSAEFLLSPYSLQIYTPEAAWLPVRPWGDLDGDGDADAADLRALADWRAGNLAVPGVDDRWLDLDESLAVDTADLVLLQLFVTGEIGALPWRR